MRPRLTMPNVTESDIRNSILDYLKYRQYPCKRNNAGLLFMSGKNGKRRAIKVGEAGWPDIEGVMKDGRYFGIEVKTEIGKQSDIQKEMEERITKSHGLYLLARSLQDVIDHGF